MSRAARERAAALFSDKAKRAAKAGDASTAAASRKAAGRLAANFDGLARQAKRLGRPDLERKYKVAAGVNREKAAK